MITKSQDVKDFMRGSDRHAVVHADLGSRAEELFKESVPLDQTIYKQWSAYVSESEAGRDYGKDLDRMRKQSPDLDDWLSYELADIQKGLPEQRYGSSFEDVAQQYLSGEGKELAAYQLSKGRSFYDLTRIGTADLGDAVAGVALYGGEAALLGNINFEEKVSQLAASYGVTRDLATRYVLDHESAHLGQKGKYFDDHVQAELDVENTLSEFYKSMAELKPDYAVEYNKLAEIAMDRAESVGVNYGGLPALASADYSSIGASEN